MAVVDGGMRFASISLAVAVVDVSLLSICAL